MNSSANLICLSFKIGKQPDLGTANSRTSRDCLADAGNSCIEETVATHICFVVWLALTLKTHFISRFRRFSKARVVYGSAAFLLVSAFAFPVKASSPLTGAPALQQLKDSGQYESLAAAMVVAEGKVTLAVSHANVCYPLKKDSSSRRIVQLQLCMPKVTRNDTAPTQGRLTVGQAVVSHNFYENI